MPMAEDTPRSGQIYKRSLCGYPLKGLAVSTLRSRLSLGRKGLRKGVTQALLDMSPELFGWELRGPRNPEWSLKGRGVGGSWRAYPPGPEVSLPSGWGPAGASVPKHEPRAQAPLP